MNEREPCACGAPTPPGKWRCPDCQVKAETKPAPLLRIVAALRNRPV